MVSVSGKAVSNRCPELPLFLLLMDELSPEMHMRGGMPYARPWLKAAGRNVRKTAPSLVRAEIVCL